MYEIQCHGHFRTGLHVGSGTEEITQRAFRRTVDGRVVVPGTSLAGAIRTHLTRLAPAITSLEKEGIKIVCDALQEAKPPLNDEDCRCIVCHLMGDINPQPIAPAQTGNVTGTRASRLTISDGIIESGETFVQDGVSIDRADGAAARDQMAKYDQEVTRDVKLRFSVSLEDANDLDRLLVRLIIDEMYAGRVYLGGSKGRGLGGFTLDGARSTQLNLNDPTHLLHFLREDFPDPAEMSLPPAPGRTYHDAHRRVGEGRKQPDLSLSSWIRVDVVVKGTGFFITNDQTRADLNGFNHYALPILPGSSIRGVLRSHAERVARTIANENSTDEESFLSHLPAAYPQAGQRDQTAKEQERRIRLESTASRIQRDHGLNESQRENPQYEWFDLAERLFGTTYFGSRLIVEDAPLSIETQPKVLDFLAVDRFTGGGADGAKFDALAYWQPEFTISLYLETPQPWEIGWLLVVLRDLMDGRLRFGFGSAKGFGAVNVIGNTITLGWTYDEAFPADNPQLVPQPNVDDFFYEVTYNSFNALPVELRRSWSAAWLDEVTNYEASDVFKSAHLAHDPYWGQRDGGLALHEIYGKQS